MIYQLILKNMKTCQKIAIDVVYIENILINNSYIVSAQPCRRSIGMDAPVTAFLMAV